ncbi:MAG TPA: DEAD/DEAH box helicase [Candidatus Subteraquimicrobiales bacterium]
MRSSRRSFSNSTKRYRDWQKYPSRNGGKRRAGFDPSVLIKKAVPNKAKTEYVHTHKFADFSVHNRLKENALARGYKRPTPIQDQAIPYILEGKDVVGMANTGTGKTAAFLIPLIDKVINNNGSRVLIVTPTRELATQIEEEFRIFGNGLKLFSTLCIGGASINRQIDKLNRKPHFVIGTPGRLKDLDQRKNLNLANFSTIVLDEVDRMLDMGFIQDVKHIIGRLPQKRHSLFFSATVTDNVRGVMQSFLTNPVFVAVESEQILENVEQEVIKTNGRAKIEVLHELLNKEGFDKVLVFGRTKRGMEKLTRQLHRRGFNVTSIHGNKSQGQRERALKQFRNSRIQALLATDVASRGLDIDNITHVINFDLPDTYEDYVHRIGRTGRAEKTGVAVTLVG